MEILYKNSSKTRSHKPQEPETVTMFTYTAFLDVPAYSELHRNHVVLFAGVPDTLTNSGVTVRAQASPDPGNLGTPEEEAVGVQSSLLV